LSRNLLIRTSVAIVAIPAILWISYTGGAWLFGMIAVFAAVASCEFLLNEGYSPRQLMFWLSLMTVAACLVVASLRIPMSPFSATSPQLPSPFYNWVAPVLILFFLVTAMITAVGRKSPAELFLGHARLVWGVTYLGLLYPFVYALGNDLYLKAAIAPSSNGDLLLFLFGLLWVGDTAAMGFGSWLGRHKLAPGVSPNKTVEGFIGGLLGSAAIGVLMYFWKFHQISFGHVMIMAIGCSVFGQLGDLVESMWKRSLGIKDSSGIIPGHGGVLDRFDSLLFAAPFLYAYVFWIL
jgi:phosphatidate cytidylyltransferase